MNIGLIFVVWPETQLQMNANTKDIVYHFGPSRHSHKHEGVHLHSIGNVLDGPRPSVLLLWHAAQLVVIDAHHLPLQRPITSPKSLHSLAQFHLNLLPLNL